MVCDRINITIFKQNNKVHETQNEKFNIINNLVIGDSIIVKLKKIEKEQDNNLFINADLVKKIN